MEGGMWGMRQEVQRVASRTGEKKKVDEREKELKKKKRMQKKKGSLECKESVNLHVT